MAAGLERVSELVSQIETASERLPLIIDLKVIVFALSPAQLKQIVGHLRLEVLFDCLNTSDGEQISATCEVLSHVVPALDLDMLLQRCGTEMLRAIRHPIAEVKELVLKQLVRLTTDDSLVNSLCEDKDLLQAAFQAIGDRNLSVGHSALDLALRLTKFSTGIDAVFSLSNLSSLMDNMKESDEVRYRVYEITVKISEKSMAHLVGMDRCKLLPSLVEEAQSEDPLLQVTALEMLAQLALQDHGLSYLQDKGLVHYLETRLARCTLSSEEPDPLSGLVLPGIMKFFGSVAHQRPKVAFSRYPVFPTALFQLVHHPDLVLRTVALETVGVVGTSAEGKLLLHAQGEAMARCMRQMGQLINNAPTEVRLKVLTSLSMLLELSTEWQTEELLMVTAGWFHHLDPRPVDLLMSICQQPFADLHVAALQIFGVLASQPWAQVVFHNYPGFLEFLLDRSREPDKASKEAKYEVVKQFAESPFISESFSQSEILQLVDYVKKGPFYVQVQAEVAIEGAS